MLIYLFYFDIFSLINSIHSHFYLVTCLLIPLCQVKSNVWQDLELSPMFRARLSSTPTLPLSHLCFTPFVFPGPPPHSVACIISVSGTLGHIDILERCNGKLRISISRHKLPAPLCHAPVSAPHSAAVCDLFRFASIWFRFALLRCGSQRFRLACCCVWKSLSFPFLSLAFLFHFHFPFCSSQFATFASDRSCLCLRRAVAKCSFPLCGAMPQRVARSFRCCKHLERCRKGAGGSRVVPSPPPPWYTVSRGKSSKFKANIFDFRH